VPVTLIAFIAAVIVTGAAVIAHSVLLLHASSFSVYTIALAVLTIVSGRFAIKVPGRAATVSVSEVFVFASAILFGPAVATLTVALDGLWVSLHQQDKRIYRTCFNVAEPAISVWAAGQVFFAIAHLEPGSAVSTSMSAVVPATIGMAAVFFALNSGLSALAVALESGVPVFHVWREHALYLAVNYHAAASVATLAVASGPRINFGVAGLVAPLLVLSYVAYREASTRVDEAHRHVADVEHLYRASVEMLAIAVDTKDQVTHGHIRRVQRHTLAVATALGVTEPRELKAIEAGALLHDIGKLAVPDYVLAKPSALTQAEFETMKKHASMGARILTAVEFPYPIVPIVRHHHEQWDGRGYPDGLVGAEIPLGARILAVVDCFDALTSDRPYRTRLSDDEAIKILNQRKGTFYDPAVVDRFVALIPELRRGDGEAAEHHDAHASVVAGLSRPAFGERRATDTRDAGCDVPRLPPAAQDLVDARVARIAHADACLFALTAAGDVLVVAHATSRIHDEARHLHATVGSGVSGWVAANRSAIKRADPKLDAPDLALAFDMKSCASVPVFVGAELFGVLTVYSRETTLSEEEIVSVGCLAQEIGLSIARGAAAPFQPHVAKPRRLSAAAVS